MASSTDCGFCADDAESRYTSRLPLTCRFRIGKSAWMRATSRGIAGAALMLPALGPAGRAARAPLRSWLPALGAVLRSCRDLGAQHVEALGLEPRRHLGAAAHGDATVEQHVDVVGREVVEDALVVRDQEDPERRALGAHLGDATGDVTERVDVEAGVGLVEHGEVGLEHRHLEDLVLLAFAAREALVEVARGEALVHAEAPGPV